MIIAIAGKNNIAVNALEYVKNNYSQHQIVVVCNRNEDGQNGWQKSLRFFANQWGIPEVKLQDLYEEEDLLFISLEFDLIVKTGKFKSKRLYNMHFSLLPKYKGMFTSVVPLLNNEGETGVTLHMMEDGIDTGDIIAQKVIPISPKDCASDIYSKCLDNAFDLFKENIDQLVNRPNDIAARRQEASNSTYYSRFYLDFEKIEIDLNQTAQGILNQIRAFNFRNYQLPRVYDNCIVDGEITEEKSTGKAGRIIEESKYCYKISTIDYNLILFKDAFDELMEASRLGDLEVIQGIPNLRAIINAQESHGWTALMVAVYNGNLSVVRYLLQEGADSTLVNHNGTTLLMYAKNEFLNSSNADMFEFVLGLDSTDFKQKDYSGKSLYDYCSEQGVSRIGTYYIEDLR